MAALTKFNYLFISCGASAKAHGAQLMKAGHEVTFWAHWEHTSAANAMADEGLRVTGGGLDGHYHPTVTTDLRAAMKGIDFVIFGVGVSEQDEVVVAMKKQKVSFEGQIWSATNARSFSRMAVERLDPNNLPHAFVDSNTSLHACRAETLASVTIQEDIKQEMKLFVQRTDSIASLSASAVQILGVLLDDPTPNITDKHRKMIEAAYPTKRIYKRIVFEHFLLSSAYILHMVPMIHNVEIGSNDEIRALLAENDLLAFYYILVANPELAPWFDGLDGERVAFANFLGYLVNTLVQGVSADKGTDFKNMTEYGKSRKTLGASFMPKLNAKYDEQEALTALVQICELMEICEYRDKAPNHFAYLTLMQTRYEAKHPGRDLIKDGRNRSKLGLDGYDKKRFLAEFSLNDN